MRSYTKHATSYYMATLPVLAYARDAMFSSRVLATS